MNEEIGPSPEDNSNPENAADVQAQNSDENGGQASKDQLEKLVIGSNAEPQKPPNTVFTSETPPEQLPNEASNSPANAGDAKASSDGSTAKDQARDTSEEFTPMPKEETPSNVTPPHDLKAGEGDKQFNIRTGNATWKNQDTDVPVEVTGHLGERDGRHFVSIAGSDTGVPLDEIRYPTDESQESAPPAPGQPAEQPTEQKAGFGQRIVGRVGRALGRSSETLTPVQPESAQPTQEEILQGKIGERRTAFETTEDVTSISLDNDQLQGVRYDPITSNHFVVRGTDGNNRYLSKEEFDRISKSDIKREEKQAEAQPQISDEDIDKKLEEFKNEKRARGSVRFGEQELTYRRFDGPEKPEPYVFKDKNTEDEVSLSEEKVLGIIRDELRLESKYIQDSERFGAQAQEKLSQAGRSLKEVSERAASLLSSAKESKVSRFLVEQGKAFLNKFDPRDKEKIPYFAGIAVGAGSNIALTYFNPFFTFGPGGLVRSAAFSGVMLGVSKGANVFRHMSMNKVLSNFGVEDKAERATYSKQYDEAFKLLSNNKEDEYGETMKKLSADIFAKHGNAQSGSDVERAASQTTAEELQKRIESLSTKYQKLNRTIRSFSAGLSAGSIGATLGVGILNVLESGNEGSGITPSEGGGPTEPPGGGVEPAPSPDATPEPGPTPTPEPEPTPAETPTAESGPDTPTGAETPPLSEIIENPEYASSVEIGQGDTIGQLLTNGGHDIDWGTDNAQVFGAHIQANYDMLQGMHDNVAAAGVSVEDFPTQAEVANLVQQAGAGDTVAMHRLTEAMHWIPAGGEFTILSPEAVELINNPQGG